MTTEENFPVGVVTVRTERVRESGTEALLALLERELATVGGAVCEAVAVKPNIDLIAEQVALIADRLQPACLFTVGGTGLHPEDLAPDATVQVIHRPAPGIAEALRTHVGRINPEFALTRGISGTRGWTLIINLPEELPTLQQCLETLKPILPAAVRQLGRLDRVVSSRQLRLL